jgi:hypothetical protein
MVTVDGRHMGAECAQVATVNCPWLALCLLLRWRVLIDERHRQGGLTLLTDFDRPTHEKSMTSFEHLKPFVTQLPTSPRRLTVATRRQGQVGVSKVSWCRSGVRALGRLGGMLK